MATPPAPAPDASAKAAMLADELGRQRDILLDEAPIRFITTALAYTLSLIFLAWPISVACAAVNLLGEVFSHFSLRRLDAAHRSSCYRNCLVAVFFIELAFATPPALIWHHDGPYVKAFAVGMVAATMMHLSTVRAIHLPMGLTGLAAVALATGTSNTMFWVWRGEYTELLLTSVALAGALAYCLGAMIQNNRLHRATTAGRAEAMAANAAKGRFLAQMSHELRTPLNAILGMGHAELRRSADPLSRERLSVLIASAEGLNAVLDDILDSSAVEDGHLPIRPQAAPLPDEIRATVELFRPGIEQSGLQLQLDLCPGLPARAVFDPHRLRQCLSNLLSNAARHTRSGGIRVDVCTFAKGGATGAGSDAENGRKLRITMSDTGPGVPIDRHEEIFEPFWRGIETAGLDGGRGLGLSISRKLARQMGGDLVLLASDEAGPALPEGTDRQAGAHFVLTLALGMPPSPASAGMADAVPAPATGWLAGKSVLVVDDVATNRMVAAAYLQSLGVRVSEAASGQAALSALKQALPDLVLLDMNMPGLDGLETLRRIRDLTGPTTRLPVIAMTADAMEEQRQHYLASGVDGYLAKPILPERLAEELNRQLCPGNQGPTSANSGR